MIETGSKFRRFIFWAFRLSQWDSVKEEEAAEAEPKIVKTTRITNTHTYTQHSHSARTHGNGTHAQCKRTFHQIVSKRV